MITLEICHNYDFTYSFRVAKEERRSNIELWGKKNCSKVHLYQVTLNMEAPNNYYKKQKDNEALNNAVDYLQ